MIFVCLICGYNQLTEPPYDADGNPSYEICPCCGFEFGFDDKSEGIFYTEYRKDWIKNGAVCFNKKLKPLNWDVKQQLRNIDIKC